MKNKYIFGLVCYSSWCGLGFVRGVNSHFYTYKKYETKDPMLYSNLITHGLFGVIIYANPFFLPFFISKEIYRIEVNVRNLEKEKKSEYYNILLV